MWLSSGRKRWERNSSSTSWRSSRHPVLKAHGCQDDAGMEFTALVVDEPNAGAVLRAALAVTVFGCHGWVTTRQVTWTMRSH